MASPGWKYRQPTDWVSDIRPWVSEVRPWLSNKKYLVAGLAATTLLALYTFNSRSSSLMPESCPPQEYAKGHWSWHPRTNITTMTSKEQAHAFSGFEGCASSREYDWHLATDTEAVWNRFPKAQSWEWTPGHQCGAMKPLDPAALVRDLVEDGGWYLVGDSVTEGHFFSLSCILYPHVRAMPFYAPNSWFDRGTPQYLYLNPDSPLVPTLNLPSGFDIASTPLVQFRRIDVLFSKEELVDIHRAMQKSKLEDDALFSDEGVWTMPPEEYLKEFFAPTPQGNFATMVVSTAGHWTETTFAKVQPPGIDGVLALFEVAMKHWAGKLQSALWENNARASAKWNWNANSPYRRNKRVVVRAYLPGHENCHNLYDPLPDSQAFEHNYYNWGQIPTFNSIFEKLLVDRSNYPDIHYLGIDRPGRMRPDAHATGDCLHIMVGAGVMEEWTHYIWHYITKEIPSLF